MSTWNVIYENYIESLKSQDHFRIIFQTIVKTDRKLKVRFAYQQLYLDKYLPKLEITSQKSNDRSETYRNQCIDAFHRGMYVDALKYCTKSIAWAPSASEQLAAAYDERSAVLFQMDRHRSSLLDINRAFALPALLITNKDKLISRKNDCLQILERTQNDTKSILNSISDFSIEDEWVREVLENGFKSCELDEDGTEIDFELKIPLPPAELENKQVLGASTKVRLDCHEKLGRHLVATEDVAPGEVILIDRPYACVILPERHYSHCSNCCVRSEVLIPCSGCSTVMFCSKKCLQQALDQYHRVECEILHSAVSLNLDKTARLALRILMVATKQGQSLNTLMEHSVYSDPFAPRPFNPEKVYDSQIYDSVQDLVDHFDAKDSRYQLYRCFLAAVVIHLLKHSTYFDSACSPGKEEQVPGVLNKYEAFAGTLILKYLYAIESNAHAITETVEREPDSPKRSLNLGVGLYPLISMGNHSCNPNLVRLNHRNVMVFYALTPVLSGEQLTDNYGIHFTTHNLEERREFIRNFLFECECEPCKFDWPLYDDLPAVIKYKAEPTPEDLVKQYTKRFEEWLANPAESTIEDEFEFLREYLVLMRPSVEQPCKVYFECQEAFRQLLLLRTNYYSYYTDLIID